jgi:hypothetical protein
MTLLMLQGCGVNAQVSVKPDFNPPVELDTVYILPFISSLVPVEVHEIVFNDFVDLLNENIKRSGVQQFEIIKDKLDDVDKTWLARQVYLSGEIWSYIENTGCCQTELRIRARVGLTEPGKQTPTFEVLLPLDSFFDHDQSTLEKEKIKLAKRLASELAERVIIPLAARK